MQEIVGSFELRRPRDVQAEEAESKANVLGSRQSVISDEERDHRRMVSEKLRAVAEWDYTDARQLRIG